jgi:hypothetical protein
VNWTPSSDGARAAGESLLGVGDLKSDAAEFQAEGRN